MTGHPPPSLPDNALHLLSGTVCAIAPGGAGPRPGPVDRVTIRYRAWDDEGLLVADVAEPLSVTVDDLPPGPAEVLQMMSGGAAALLRVPASGADEASLYDIHLDAVEVRGPRLEIPDDLRSPGLD